MNGEKILFITADSALMPAAFALRHEVFVDEQAVPIELEIDAYDQTAAHLVALSGTELVGTLRILPHAGAAKIGRVAVRKDARGTGLGTRMMAAAERYAVEQGLRAVVLDAQVSVTAFYHRLGYEESGDVFDDAGIPHIRMSKRLA